MAKIKEQSGNQNIHFLQLDLASLESVRDFSRKFHQLENRLDILINNAGIFNIPKQYTKDGFEMQMGVNHLGHFLLTNLLLDLLKSSAPSRILNIVSIVHFMGKIERDNLLSEKSYSRKQAYNNSKLANVLFARALSKRLEGTGVTCNVVRPGAAYTELHRHTNKLEYVLLVLGFFPIIKTPNEASQTPITVAVDPDLEKVSGKYFDHCKERGFYRSAQDDEAAEWLWNKSVELVGL
jgi:NAD(P)-dependent dehydrogenase (short-subunit alcohol dehydrogenase family)